MATALAKAIWPSKPKRGNRPELLALAMPAGVGLLVWAIVKPILNGLHYLVFKKPDSAAKKGAK